MPRTPRRPTSSSAAPGGASTRPASVAPAGPRASPPGTAPEPRPPRVLIAVDYSDWREAHVRQEMEAEARRIEAYRGRCELLQRVRGRGPRSGTYRMPRDAAAPPTIADLYREILVASGAITQEEADRLNLEQLRARVHEAGYRGVDAQVRRARREGRRP